MWLFGLFDLLENVVILLDRECDELITAVGLFDTLGVSWLA